MSIRKASAATSINKGMAAARAMTVNDTVRAAGGGPTITNVYVTDSSYNVLDDTAVSTSGGYIKIIGTGFASGCVVYTQGTSATSTTFVGSTEVRAQLPSTSSGTLHLYLVNPDNSSAIYLSGVVFSGVPAWSTGATLTAAYEQVAYSQSLTATGDATVSYALKAGSTLPDGVTLNPTTGALSGTTPVVASGSTTYTFTIIAIDGQNQDTERLFSLTINHDIVTWSSPANNTTYTIAVDTAISNVALSATSASGKTVSYGANSLPTGLSISGANVAGTPTVAGSTSSLITATAANTSATNTIVINWVVSVGLDTYFKNTVLLVNGERTDSNWLYDSSNNSFAISNTSDPRPSAFSPYNTNWSNYFDGTGDYLQLASNAAFQLAGDFTVEFWMYPTAINVEPAIFSIGTTDPSTSVIRLSSDKLQFWINGSPSGIITCSTTIRIGTWYHVAWVRSGSSATNVKLYLNGVQDGVTSSAKTGTITAAPLVLARYGSTQDSGSFAGYLSNVRLTKDHAVYTANFTPPTSQLPKLANTQLLTCQSNRIIDNSNNAFTITKFADVAVRAFGPYVETDLTTGSGYFYSNDNNAYGNQYLQTGGGGINLTGTSTFTIEAWIYPRVRQAGARGVIIGDALGAGGTENWSFGVTTAGLLNFYWYQAGVKNCTGSTTLPLNAWSHVAISISTGVIKLFVNGAVETLSGTTTTTAPGSSLGYYTIGRVQDTTYPFLGNIADLRVVTNNALYSTAFTPPTAPLTAVANTSLLTLRSRNGHDNNAPVDTSGNRLQGTKFGNATQGTFSPFSQPEGYWSNYFDGGGNLTLPSSANLAPGSVFTFEAWVYLTSAPNGWVFYEIGATNGFQCGFNSTTSWGVAARGTAWRLTSTTLPINNQWNHVVVSRGGTGTDQTSLFLNGVRVAIGTVSDAFTTTGSLTIGTYCVGYLSNVRLVKGTDVYGYTNTTITVPTAPLPPIGNTQVLACRSNQFIDNSTNKFTITRSGNTIVQPYGPFTSPRVVPDGYYSNYFDGTGDSLVSSSSANLAPGTVFTFEAWIYFPTAAVAGACVYGTSNGGGFQVGYEGTGNWGVAARDTAWRFTTTTLPTAGQWNHIVVSRGGTGTNQTSLFLNGVRVAIGTVSDAFSTAGAVQIGFDGASNYWTGWISNLRVVNGVDVYGYTNTTITVPTIPLTAVSGTQMLTCQSDLLIDNSNNAFTFTRNGDVRAQSFSPFTLPVSTYTESYNGGSGYYDGTGDYHSFPLALTNLGNFTLECWVYGNNNISGMAICGSNEFELYLSTLTVNWVYQGVINVNSGLNLVPGQWNHIVVCRYNFALNAAGLFKIFVNGVMYSGPTAKGENMPIPGPFITGGSYYTNAFRNPWPGYISNVRLTSGNGTIYTTAFTPPVAPVAATRDSQLMLNYTNAGIIDQGGDINLETVGNTRISNAVEKYSSGSVFLNPSYATAPSGYLYGAPSLTTTFGLGDFTVEFWFNWITTASRQDLLWWKGTKVGGILWNLSANNVTYYIDGAAINAPLTPTTNTWYHIALSRSSGTSKLFINGVQGGSSFADTKDYSGLYEIYSGRDQGAASNWVNGYIDDLRITKGVARYTANFTPPTELLAK